MRTTAACLVAVLSLGSVVGCAVRHWAGTSPVQLVIVIIMQIRNIEDGDTV